MLALVAWKLTQLSVLAGAISCCGSSLAVESEQANELAKIKSIPIKIRGVCRTIFLSHALEKLPFLSIVN